MNRDQHDPHEQALLEHFRAHSRAEPSAELDARILAAARAAQVSSRPSWSQRLYVWLFGAGGRQRWSLAVAGLACVGIGVSLTWRTLEQAPETYDAVMPRAVMAPAAPVAEAEAPQDLLREQAPAMQSYSQTRQKAEKKESAPEEMRKQAPSASEALSDALAPEGAPSMAAGAAPQASKVVQSQSEQLLAQLLELRRAGKVDEAKALQQRLQRDYPQLDIEAQLQRLENNR
ncbi:hypothetical protein D3C85_419070 [compost metagenome]